MKASDPQRETKNAVWATKVLRMAMIILAFIGIGAVVRRTLALEGMITSSFSPSEGPAFDSAFNEHKLITLAHILPGSLFMILGPLQFMPKLREKHPRFHRWNGRMFLVAALTVGATAIALPFLFLPIGGVVEGAGSVIFGSYFLTALINAWRCIRAGDVALHREWMIRAFSIGLAVSTIRPLIGMFFAFSDLQPQQFFGMAFWIGFVLHAIVAELWIKKTRAGAV